MTIRIRVSRAATGWTIKIVERVFLAEVGRSNVAESVAEKRLAAIMSV
jgi:hypothetical protein